MSAAGLTAAAQTDVVQWAAGVGKAGGDLPPGMASQSDRAAKVQRGSELVSELLDAHLAPGPAADVERLAQALKAAAALPRLDEASPTRRWLNSEVDALADALAEMAAGGQGAGPRWGPAELEREVRRVEYVRAMAAGAGAGRWEMDKFAHPAGLLNAALCEAAVRGDAQLVLRLAADPAAAAEPGQLAMGDLFLQGARLDARGELALDEEFGSLVVGALLEWRPVQEDAFPWVSLPLYTDSTRRCWVASVALRPAASGAGDPSALCLRGACFFAGGAEVFGKAGRGNTAGGGP